MQNIFFGLKVVHDQFYLIGSYFTPYSRVTANKDSNYSPPPVPHSKTCCTVIDKLPSHDKGTFVHNIKKLFTGKTYSEMRKNKSGILKLYFANSSMKATNLIQK